MDGQAPARWQAIRNGSEASWNEHSAMSALNAQHKLMYWRDAPTPPPPQAPQPRPMTMVDRKGQSDGYCIACNTAQRQHDSRLKAKNNALRSNGAQTTRYVKDRVTKLTAAKPSPRKRGAKQ
jgi:hypothetical protein